MLALSFNDNPVHNLFSTSAKMGIDLDYLGIMPMGCSYLVVHKESNLKIDIDLYFAKIVNTNVIIID